MGTQIPPQTSLEDFINQRRQMLLGDSSDISTTTEEEEPTPPSNPFLDMLSKSTLPGVSSGIEAGKQIASGDFRGALGTAREFATDELLPMALGGLGAAGRVPRVVRKFSPFRLRGAKGAREVSRAESVVGSSSITGPQSVNAYTSMGSKLFNKSLGGPNPSEFARAMSTIPQNQRIYVQRGMLESLRENIANANRLTAQMQQNLLSPAGRARLQVAFEGLPPQAMDRFIRLVETGQHQNVTRWLTLVPVLIPLARRLGWDVVGAILP